VCGKLTDATGGPVSGIILRILKDGIEVASVESGRDGTFIFDNPKAGSYVLSAQAPGYLRFQSPIVVTKPEKRCRRGLSILLQTEGENCGSRVVK
jgi:hypothetical protein